MRVGVIRVRLRVRVRVSVRVRVRVRVRARSNRLGSELGLGTNDGLRFK